MSKTIINFAHANGFPAKVYSKMFSALEDDFQIIYKDMYAHDERYPITKDWMILADELIDFIESKTNEPVIGIGHSFGGSITLNAAFKRPDLFKCIILLDPVVFSGWRKPFAKLLDAFNLLHIMTPARKSEGRQAIWQDMESAENYFRSKSLFNQLDNDCLQDYLKYGLIKTNKGYELAFKVEKEVGIFMSLPYHFDKYTGLLKDLPGLLLTGKETNVSKPTFMKHLVKQHNFDWKIVDGGHMFPLELPVNTAEHIRNYIKKL